MSRRDKFRNLRNSTGGEGGGRRGAEFAHCKRSPNAKPLRISGKAREPLMALGADGANVTICSIWVSPNRRRLAAPRATRGERRPHARAGEAPSGQFSGGSDVPAPSPRGGVCRHAPPRGSWGILRSLRAPQGLRPRRGRGGPRWTAPAPHPTRRRPARVGWSACAPGTSCCRNPSESPVGEFPQPALVLQRRFTGSPPPALGVSAGGAAVAGLGVDQPTPQLGPGPPAARQQFAQHPAHLGNGQGRQLFPPTPAARAAGRRRPAGRG